MHTYPSAHTHARIPEQLDGGGGSSLRFGGSGERLELREGPADSCSTIVGTVGKERRQPPAPPVPKVVIKAYGPKNNKKIIKTQGKEWGRSEGEAAKTFLYRVEKEEFEERRNGEGGSLWGEVPQDTLGRNREALGQSGGRRRWDDKRVEKSCQRSDQPAKMG